jgi:membrane-associated phospholipid phosphatase
LFQVEPVLWLQSFASPFTVWLMGAITWLGTVKCLSVFVLFLAFAVRFRVGLALVILLCANSLATDLTKDACAIPRPGDVDTRVRQLGGDASRPVTERGGATAFWSSLPGETLAVARSTAGLSWAFPSGHVTSAAALTVAIALLFASRRMWLLPAIWIPLTGVSRLFLGRHFLADAVGGALFGGLLALLGALLFGKMAMGLERGKAAPWRRVALIGLAAAALGFAVMVPGLDVATVGRLVVAAMLLYLAPALAFRDEAHPLVRLARFVFAAVIATAAFPAAAALFEAAGMSGTPRGAMLQTALTTLVVFGGGAAAIRFLPFAGRGSLPRPTVGEA